MTSGKESYTYVPRWGAPDEVHDAHKNRARIVKGWDSITGKKTIEVEIYLARDDAPNGKPSCALAITQGHTLLKALGIDPEMPQGFKKTDSQGTPYYEMTTEASAGLIACPQSLASKPKQSR